MDRYRYRYREWTWKYSGQTKKKKPSLVVLLPLIVALWRSISGKHASESWSLLTLQVMARASLAVARLYSDEGADGGPEDTQCRMNAHFSIDPVRGGTSSICSLPRNDVRSVHGTAVVLGHG